jgi:beta-lactam-binding protein with PASTA domain
MTVLAARYELLDKVGEGGMSVVWRARDLELEREVAIKQIRSFVAGDFAHSRRFHREARALAALAHEHIVRIFDYVSSDEQSFLVMEYVPGANLAQATHGKLPLSPAQAAAYLEPVARALAHAHARGVVHRDLTPSNILIEDGSSRVVATDFGLARIARTTGSMTATGVLLGTPEYWSPELALGRESGPAADLYALGCVLFLLVSAQLPFEGDDRLAVGLRRAHEDAPSLRSLLPRAPRSLVDLVDSLLDRDPERRPDATVVAAQLRVFGADDEPQPAGVAAPRAVELETIALASEKATLPPAPAAPSARRRWWARRRILAALAASSAVIIAALVLAGGVRSPLVQVPNVVSLQEDVARAQIQRSLPTATVEVEHVYSTRVGAGLVIRQRPQPRRTLTFGSRVQLVVSKGTPFALVPGLAGKPAAAARGALARRGFASRYAYAPSWIVRKGSVIGLQPRSGTFVHRPATITIVVASGYPRSVVPDVRGQALAAAEQQLGSAHLRYRLVWDLTDAAPPGQVLEQIPRPGSSVYQGARVRLTVARTLHWVKLFAVSGSHDFESDPFTVPARWRIRYRLSASELGLGVARFAWTGTDEFGGHSFLASHTGSLRTYVSSDGAGSYRLAVHPFIDTPWYVEVDVLE